MHSYIVFDPFCPTDPSMGAQVGKPFAGFDCARSRPWSRPRISLQTRSGEEKETERHRKKERLKKETKETKKQTDGMAGKEAGKQIDRPRGKETD